MQRQVDAVAAPTVVTSVAKVKRTPVSSTVRYGSGYGAATDALLCVNATGAQYPASIPRTRAGAAAQRAPLGRIRRCDPPPRRGAAQSRTRQSVAAPVDGAGRRSLSVNCPGGSRSPARALGLVIIALHHFRWGNLLIAGSMLAAALLRLVLPARQAGLLAVRSRFVDVVTMGAIGGALLVLALVTRT